MRAKVVTNLPEDAKLYVDGERVGFHTFHTPPLQPGQRYFYTLRAEAKRNGEMVSETRQVIVEAGRTSQVAFGSFDTANRAASAQVTVHLPEEARLYVDGQLVPLRSTKRTFSTPKLEAGRRYYYTLRAEIVRSGETIADSQRVIVEAGKEVEVRFDRLNAQVVSR